MVVDTSSVVHTLNDMENIIKSIVEKRNPSNKNVFNITMDDINLIYDTINKYQHEYNMTKWDRWEEYL